MPGYALVDRNLRYELAAGSNAISASNVPPSMDVEAALLRPESGNVNIIGQRYVAALSGTDDVLGRAIGRRVTVEHTAGSAKQTDSGILLAASDGLSLALNDGRIKVIRDYDNFSIAATGNTLPREANLQWTVEAEQAGDASFVLSYPMSGMAWRAEYLATIAPGADCSLALDGAALVINRSGVGFDNANLTLVAGQPARARQSGYMGDRYRAEVAADFAMAAAAPPMPVVRGSGEYHAYVVPGTSRVSNGAVERLPLFAPRQAVACSRDYVTDAGTSDWTPPRPMLAPDQRGLTGSMPVNVSVSFDNDREAGLGQPLPAGRVRVFDGSDFLGESMLGHTPAGNEVRLRVGKAFDITADREATAFNVDNNRRRITESFAVTVRNAKDEEVTVRVLEPMQRWRDWEITASSLPAQKKDAQNVEFEVPVPAQGETRLTYTVRYQWPEGVRP
ncbi:DUF4139 domain-containing protein [Marilutibacter alkalisoli]|uniref:DUF4139 domain-containing protein n=1 Tax=Marilutibacter alkalisoli TaxID=2591633 RepID=A0A514BT94_9GAMM|nr:DUF4139 domain-containing protein [Lysobacter alkalisoli]QDH70592.1 DUF4139 domain-containing protein [Lysobacter alkalisoli]